MSAFYTAVARYFDAENADKTDDLQLYSRLAAQYPGDILDVGCGTGRVLLHLAEQRPQHLRHRQRPSHAGAARSQTGVRAAAAPTH